ncbi:hypothetical protein MTP99_004812 [Tenebrio molitor]|nr:hypothetical protein MTP99_004812 [Tenebrio molitor]
MWEEGHRLNHYTVLCLNNTICIIQNGYVLKEADSYAAKQIYLKFWSKQESLYTFFKECEHETRKPCDIQCQTCKNVETSTEFSKEHVTNANDNTMHEDNLENQNSDDSENIQKCSDCNTESTDSSTGSSTFSSTESSTKAPPNLKFCKGSSITTKEDNLRFTIETPLSDVLTFHLAVDNILRIFPIFQERKQTNDYNVLSVNNTIYIIKNGQNLHQVKTYFGQFLMCVEMEAEKTWKLIAHPLTQFNTLLKIYR